MDEVRVFGRCVWCDDEVTDENEEYYVNEYGEVFCCIDCLLEHYEITKVEI